ncbi:MAG: NAD(P)H-dependent glycerol-3-phosphate dehydrogenase [bacterium]
MTVCWKKITVVGAGSWGTALAIQLARAGVDVSLWGRETDEIQQMQEYRENNRYLPGIQFPENLSPETDLNTALENSDSVLVVTPSHAFQSVLELLEDHLKKTPGLAWASKGFEPGTGRMLHEVAERFLGKEHPIAAVSGPSFAKEVAMDLPTAVTVASNESGFADQWAVTLHGGSFRTYTSPDLTGVELGGAVKNVLAIATGLSDGMGLGDNARAALITRGLAEIMRLGAALGAETSTLMGLSGMGDLVLTCTGGLSRNRRFGLALGAGKTPQQALDEIGQVVEGERNAEEVVRLAQKLRVEMPISEQVYAIVSGKSTPKQGLHQLMQRQPRAECE